MTVVMNRKMENGYRAMEIRSGETGGGGGRRENTRNENADEDTLTSLVGSRKKAPEASSAASSLIVRYGLFVLVGCFAAGVAVGLLTDNLRASPGSAVGLEEDWRSAQLGLRVPVELQTDLADPRPDAPWPRVCWLMSFPNSGTSFTTRLVRTATRYYTASNYGESNKGPDGVSIPIFDDSPGGPFRSEPLSNLDVPDHGYVLTKTHCLGYCMECGPERYVETSYTFLRGCLRGKYIGEGDDGQPTRMVGQYDRELVHKVVHLIRDPFDNVVARFHLNHNKAADGGDEEKTEKYPYNKEGFLAFCRDVDKDFAQEEQDSRFIEGSVLADVKNVPCHADFFRYVQWHDLGFTTTHNLGLPTMILHYEDYTTNFDETMHQLLGFLELEVRGDPKDFSPGHTYREYFTDKQVAAVKSMMMELASRETWSQVSHYFP